MDEGDVVVFVLLFLLAFIPAFLAKRKGRSFFLWYLFGAFFFFPAIIAVFLVSALRKCPYCIKKIHKDAIVCPHCRKNLEERTNWLPPELETIPRQSVPSGKKDPWEI